jgi:hypothetical protein
MDISFIISIASLGACALFFIYCGSYIKRRTGEERILAEFRAEVSKLISEIDVATDRDATLVEDRIKTLRTLLDDVDKRITLYDQELNKRRINEETYAELGRRRLAVSGQRTPEFQSAAAQTLINQENPVEIGKSEKQQPEEKKEKNEAPRVSAAPEIEPKPLPLPEQIAELFKAGFSPNLIATRLGISISEIELAIAIAEQRS